MHRGLLIYLVYLTLGSIVAQPPRTRHHTEIIFSNLGNVKTNRQPVSDAGTLRRNFLDDSQRIQFTSRQGRQPPGAGPTRNSKYYFSQHVSNGYRPEVNFPGTSIHYDQYRPVRNSYGSEYPNHESYPVQDPCESGYSNYEYPPTQNTFHRGTPSYISINEPHLTGGSYDTGLNIWTSPNGVKTSRSSGFDYKFNVKY